MSPGVAVALTLGWCLVAALAATGAAVGLFRRLVERSVLQLSGINGRSALIANQRVRLWGKRLGVLLIDLGIGLTVFLALVDHAPGVVVVGLATAAGLVANLLWEAAEVGADLWSERQYLRLPEEPPPPAGVAVAGMTAALAACHAALARMTEDRDRLVEEVLRRDGAMPERPADDTARSA